MKGCGFFFGVFFGAPFGLFGLPLGLGRPSFGEHDDPVEFDPFRFLATDGAFAANTALF